MKKSPLYKPVVLLIIDGWGISPTWSGNAISSARPRHFDYYWRNYPHLVLQAFGAITNDPNLSFGSEVGHVMIGTGRKYFPKSILISDQIRSGRFFENQILGKIVTRSFESGGRIHLVGLVSNSKRISNLEHLEALIVYFKNKGIKNLYLHLILDGKDTEAAAGVEVIDTILRKISELNLGKIVTLCGRSWVFDGEAAPNKIDDFVKCLISARGRAGSEVMETLKGYYSEKVFDADIPPTILMSENPHFSRIKNSDQIILFDFEGDNLKNFLTQLSNHNKEIFTLTDYHSIKAIKIFPDTAISQSLSEIVSKNGLNQIKICESYKKNHLTYFFDGLNNREFPEEERKIIPSETDIRADIAPQLKLYDVTKEILKNLDNFNLVITNFANVDMVAHTQNLVACQNAISYVDGALSSVVEETVRKGGCVIICSDHGNAENITSVNLRFRKKDHHTLNPVPFILISPDHKIEEKPQLLQLQSRTNLAEIIQNQYTIADIAPTALELLGLDKPSEMSGKSLLEVLNLQK